ncbi:unnamed protein product [Hymenolepis diminuta]|uniref:RING-type domain-containing protein n=1 Tax=Hymenolepis diminuta TaxID=6216 RepID=A0A0R3SK79_HYMDI|nr:unnamed protein product [Hymenolepis diminuta]
MEQLTCAICQEGITLPVGQPDCCEHKYCTSCLEDWVEVNSSCPQDRKPILKILVSEKIGGSVTKEIPVLYISPALSNSYSSLGEAIGYSPESLYDYYGLTIPHYQPSSPRFAFQNRSPYLPRPLFENFDELNRLSSADLQSICSFDFLDIAGTKIGINACEDENHSISTFEMLESHCMESIDNLNNIFEADDNIDEYIKNIVNSNFYREFSYADWLHRLANLLAHIWEELDNNVNLYGDIISCGAQYGNRLYNLARIYVHAVQLFENFTAKAIKIIFYFYFIIMDNINS